MHNTKVKLMIARVVLCLFLHCFLEVHWSCHPAEKQEILAGCLQWRLSPTVTMVTKAFNEVVCLIHTLFSSRGTNNFT